jgi:glucosamine--fructose-6-phosphate aminotransferase (isomerizing)
MCGIVGYTGLKQADLVLVPALQRLEYRGYDSAGLATIFQGRIQLRKKAGKIHNLVKSLQDFPVLGTTGISHTRWATHGPANDVNAHPHLGGSSSIALVHNGVIENYSSLKTFLEDMDYQFKSETDTEVLAHLVSYHFDKISEDIPTVDNLVQAVIAALSLVKGTYGIALVCPLFPNLVIGSRLGSPLVLGLGDGEHFLASDPSALIGFSNRAIYLDDRQICVLTPDSWSILDMKQVQISDPGQQPTKLS